MSRFVPYESERAVSEYLLFHYGTPDEVLPYGFGPRDALGFPVRCVTECVDAGVLPLAARALDLGCAVGRSAFELGRFCHEVVAIDDSRKFIEAARALRRDGEVAYRRMDEGEFCTELTARLPEGVDPGRVDFQEGDAEKLPEDLGKFDVVLMANLIDRLGRPHRCLERLSGLVRPGGQLVVTSPFTWMEEYTSKEYWLGGRLNEEARTGTEEALKSRLNATFEHRESRDMPFLIREHARKFQWSVARAMIWRRRAT